MDWRILTARICLSTPIPGKAFIPTGRPTFSTTVVARFRSFLLSSAIFWLDKYHATACAWTLLPPCCIWLFPQSWRVDCKQFGGRENLEAISFLRR